MRWSLFNVLFFFVFFILFCNVMQWSFMNDCVNSGGMDEWIAAFALYSFLSMLTSSYYWMIMALSCILNYCKLFFLLFLALFSCIFKNFNLKSYGKNFHHSCKKSFSFISLNIFLDSLIFWVVNFLVVCFEIKK